MCAQLLPRTSKKAAEEAPSSSPSPTALPPGLCPDPFLEPLSICHLLRIRNFRLELSLSTIEAQQRRHASDQVRHAKIAAQYVWGVVLDLTEGDATLLLADTCRYEFSEERRDLFAGVAVGGRPECQEGRAGGGREEKVGREVVWTTNTATG